jgi:hypothetical protein
MSFKEVQVGTSTYELPLQGANPPWGEELTDLIEALVDAVNVAQGPNDITETSVTLINTAGIKNINGLAFNPLQVRSAEISYNISRRITKAVSNIPTGTGVITITTATPHNLNNNNVITLNNTNCVPSIDGVYNITKISNTEFSINIGIIEITDTGNLGNFDIELVESGIMLCNYGLQGWSLSMERIGNALANIELLSSGQFTYEPTILTGSSHNGIIKFIAKALIKV